MMRSFYEIVMMLVGTYGVKLVKMVSMNGLMALGL